ncbi:fibronectin/fibrinogen-binding protein [Paenibacillus spiritus]|uniref:Rqc2 homolog RqcH n=1 Tax=Paenibacillus spiritus TaxID=2496557 RepID=A0A5J5G8Q6_9BACL|nr:NFACT RNA binding domain-containing protein [Paenibacillus spiritus]KAA9004049.1 fibronectin/fibrinogen-binding protein [Paenibacillus spiritus]
MALDGIVTRAIVSELQACTGQRISKIYQPSDHDLVFTLRGAGGGRLLLSANPTYPRVHFTERQGINPSEAPMFCMLMRKHCEGGVIESVEQIGLERIIHMRIRQRDELGDVSAKILIIELMGRHSNLILTDAATGTIIDGIHHVTPAISSYRIVMPGFAYTEPPRQHKRNPLETSREEFAGLFRQAAQAAAAQVGGDESASGQEAESAGREPAGSPAEAATAAPSPLDDPAGWIVASFSGISPLIAQDMVRRSEFRTAEALADAFEATFSLVRASVFTPKTGFNTKGKPIFSAVPLSLFEGETKRYPTISACMEDYYGDKAERDTVKQRVSDLIRFLSNERSKNLKKLDKLRQDQEEAQDADRYRIYGELIFASLHALKKGDREARLVNYYDENQAEIDIPLDPLLTPSDNAQRYFKKYNKYKNSLAVIDEQTALTREEITYMESLLQQLDHASLNDIEEIRDELVSGGYLRDRSKKGKKKKKPSRPTLQVFTSSEGIEIYVGKNNLQNEYLTNRLAGPNDTWLHTKDIPGSHVVIRSESFGDATLEEAAQLAAYFSQAKQSSSVPVDSTLIRYVRKPNGSKPGFVIYDRQKTLYVTPDEDRIRALPSALRS